MYLPVEILGQVANSFVEKSDMAAAALVNWEWYSAFTPVLYQHIKVTESISWQATEVEEVDLSQMAGLISALNRNPYLGSLVHSIEHTFFDSDTFGKAHNLKERLEFPLRNIRLQLQEIVDRNGFPRVTKLSLFSPDIGIAGMLLRGLYPQLEVLYISSEGFRYLPFRQLAGLPSKLRELEMVIYYEPILTRGQSLFGNASHGNPNSVMHMDVNAFLTFSASLRILRITGAQELDTLFEGITLPHLHTLETTRLFSSHVDQTAACLASFLNRNLSISRLAMRRLPDQGETISSISCASSAGIRELISSVEEVTDDYLIFLKGFRNIRTFKLELDIDESYIILTNLIEIMGHLHRDHQSGIKGLVLPMPSYISQRGENLARSKIRLARDALSDFGMAFRNNLPEVEVFGISQVGGFRKLEAVEWAHALAGHPRLKKLAIKTPFLSSSRLRSKTRQEVIDEIAQEFSALPQLEHLVFPEGPDWCAGAVQVLIVRGELGVSGKAATVEKSMVDEVFFDPFFEDT